MSKYPKLTHYVSEIDKDLQRFDEQHPELTLAQKKEKEKYDRIYFLRDIADRPDQSDKIWGDF